MHPVLVNIPVHLAAPYLATPVVLLLAALVGGYFFLQARRTDPSHAVGAAITPAVVTAALLLVIRGTRTPWPLHTYGVLIAVGFILGIAVTVREARRTGFDEEAVLDMGFWGLVAGMVGARAYFIVVNWREYFITRPWIRVEALPFDIPAVLAVWQGGLVFYGGAIGAVAAFFWFSRKRNLPYGRFADIVIPGLPLGHALGRLGCFAAGCCWGDSAYHMDSAGLPVAEVSFAAQFPRESLAYQTLLRSVPEGVHDFMVQSGHTAPLYPTQWMEALGEVMIFGVLLLVLRRKAFHGQVAATYFMLYPLLRATMEFFRGDSERGWIIQDRLSVGQFTSILVAGGALMVMLRLFQRSRTLNTPAPGPQPA